jgi:hypothetical protein
VKPNNAQVFVDGGYVGTADSFDGWWQRLNVESGIHRLVFRAAGFQPYVLDLNVVPGQDYKVKYEMQPGQDAISQQDMLPPQNDNDRYDRGDRRYRNDDRYPNDDRYRDDDQYEDQGPQGPQGPQYDPNGGYQDQNPNGGYQPQSSYDPRRPSERYGHQSTQNGAQPPYDYNKNTQGEVQGQFGDDDGHDGDADVKSAHRTFNLQVQPADATVYIDGTYYGSGEAGQVAVMLPDGAHKLEVVRPGYATFTKDIQVGQNATPTMTVMLQKK